MARQQPVAGGLRTLVTSLRMSADLERMGDLARRVAKVTPMRYAECVVPEELRSTFAQMSEIGADLTENIARIVEDKDVEIARTLEGQDDAVDQLHRAVFVVLLSKDNPYTIEKVIGLTLLNGPRPLEWCCMTGPVSVVRTRRLGPVSRLPLRISGRFSSMSSAAGRASWSGTAGVGCWCRCWR